eukprot:6214379-Pleurochrysis_carterae.AAC.3
MSTSPASLHIGRYALQAHLTDINDTTVPSNPQIYRPKRTSLSHKILLLDEPGILAMYRPVGQQREQMTLSGSDA